MARGQRWDVRIHPSVPQHMHHRIMQWVQRLIARAPRGNFFQAEITIAGMHLWAHVDTRDNTVRVWPPEASAN